MIRLAAWQPLLFAPGSRYHHGNIGWNIVGLIAARVGVSRCRFCTVSGFSSPSASSTAPATRRGPIAGPHAHGYEIAADGALSDTTAQAPFKGADGAIISNGADTATFSAGCWAAGWWTGGASWPCAAGALGLYCAAQERWRCLVRRPAYHAAQITFAHNRDESAYAGKWGPCDL
jgi:hypothetical protein